MTEFTLLLIIVLIPGIIASIIYNKLSIHPKWSSFDFLLYSSSFGVLSYLILQILFYFFINDYQGQPLVLDVWNILELEFIPYKDVMWASLVGVILGIVMTLITQNKIIYNWAQFLQISNKYGDDTLFNHFLNSDEIIEIYIRDIGNNLTYHGIVNFFSKSDDVFEIVLSDTTVYRYEDSCYLYDIERIYLTLEKINVRIEQVKVEKDGKES